MIERELTIVNQLGMHARPAAQVVRTASAFKADVEIVRDGMAVNAKSIMGVMMLAAECGCSVVVRASGDDEAAAVDALAKLVSEGFGED